MGLKYPKEAKRKFKKEVLRLRNRGFNFKEIGAELGIATSFAFQLSLEDKEFKDDLISKVRKCRDEHQSYSDIARNLGIGATTVRAVLLRADEEKEQEIQSAIMSRSGKKGADARWAQDEATRRESVLKMRHTQSQTLKKRRKVIEPEKMDKEKGPTRAVAYLRVSTEEQARKGISLDFQKSLIKNWAAAKEWELVDIIRDPGSSGKNLKRPGIQQVMKMCREDEIDTVIIYKLDRLSRRIKDMVDVVEVLERHKVDLSSVTESLDTSTAMGRMFFWMMTVIGALERERIGERVSDARLYREQKGEWTGRLPHGYELAFDDKGVRVKGKLVVNPKKFRQYKTAKEIWETGTGVRPVAEKLGINYGLATRLIKTDIKKLKKRMGPFLIPTEKNKSA